MYPRSAVEPIRLPVVRVEAELGRDHYLVTTRSERFAYKLFVRERPLDLHRVEEGDPRLTADRMSSIISPLSAPSP